MISIHLMIVWLMEKQKNESYDANLETKIPIRKKIWFIVQIVILIYNKIEGSHVNNSQPSEVYRMNDQ